MIPKVKTPTVRDIQQAYLEGEIAVMILFFNWATDVIEVINYMRNKLIELNTAVHMDVNKYKDN
jgi:hypothetical protein